MDPQRDEIERLGLTASEATVALKMGVSLEAYAKAKIPAPRAESLVAEQARILRGLAASIGVSDVAKAELLRMAATAEASGEVVR